MTLSDEPCPSLIAPNNNNDSNNNNDNNNDSNNNNDNDSNNNNDNNNCNNLLLLKSSMLKLYTQPYSHLLAEFCNHPDICTIPPPPPSLLPPWVQNSTSRWCHRSVCLVLTVDIYDQRQSEVQNDGWSTFEPTFWSRLLNDICKILTLFGTAEKDMKLNLSQLLFEVYASQILKMWHPW